MSPVIINAKPTNSDKSAIEGKFKSAHNKNDNLAGLMTKTFYGLLALADIDSAPSGKEKPTMPESVEASSVHINTEASDHSRQLVSGLHYNIQIHLPATKDLEVYNAIFKSLKENLLEK